MEHPIDKDEPWAVLAASRHDAAAAATRSPLSSRAGEHEVPVLLKNVHCWAQWARVAIEVARTRTRTRTHTHTHVTPTFVGPPGVTH